MTDTNQLPPHTITIHDHPEPHIMQWSDLELAAVKRYAEQYALQARAQVQGEVCPTCGETEPYTGSCGTSNNDTKALCKKPAHATQAEVTDAEIVAVMRDGNNCNYNDEAEHIQFARAILALRPQQSGLTGCNGGWDGDTQVQWCELHLAHKEAIHEWAERAKEAEKQLSLRPERVPMTDEQVDSFRVDGRLHWLGKRQLIRAVEAHHDITTQAKKESM